MLDSKFTGALERSLCCCLKRPLERSSFDDKRFHLCTKFGNTVHLYGKRDSMFPFHAVLGPDWPVVLLVYFLIIIINISALRRFSNTLGPYITNLGWYGAIILLVCYTAVACTDPGTIFEGDVSYRPVETNEQVTGDIENNFKKSCSNDKVGGHSHLLSDNNNGHDSSSEDEMIEDKRIRQSKVMKSTESIECGHCKINRPITARHCSYCSQCVDHLDHHCPWCGKCIGRRNMVYFQAFLCTLCVQTYFLIGVTIYYFLCI